MRSCLKEFSKYPHFMLHIQFLYQYECWCECDSLWLHQKNSFPALHAHYDCALKMFNKSIFTCDWIKMSSFPISFQINPFRRAHRILRIANPMLFFVHIQFALLKIEQVKKNHIINEMAKTYSHCVLLRERKKTHLNWNMTDAKCTVTVCWELNDECCTVRTIFDKQLFHILRES